MLAYSVPSDFLDENLKKGEYIAIRSMKILCSYCRYFWRAITMNTVPNAKDVAKLLYIGKKCGFPRMLESLDCMQ